MVFLWCSVPFLIHICKFGVWHSETTPSSANTVTAYSSNLPRCVEKSLKLVFVRPNKPPTKPAEMGLLFTGYFGYTLGCCCVVYQHESSARPQQAAIVLATEQSESERCSQDILSSWRRPPAVNPGEGCVNVSVNPSRSASCEILRPATSQLLD